MLIDNNSTLLMIGDSITDCNRIKLSEEGIYGSLGNGYVSMVASLLTSVYPEKRIRIENRGISGNTVRDLAKRWQTDVIDLKPGWLSIMIGINDVWRQFDMPLYKEWHVYIEEYENTLEKLVRETLPLVKGMVLMTPYIIEANKNDAMREVMDSYGEVVKKLSVKYGTYFVDTQAAFDEYLKQYHAYSLAWDRIHPNMTGYMIIARAFLNAVGFEWKK